MVLPWLNLIILVETNLRPCGRTDSWYECILFFLHNGKSSHSVFHGEHGMCGVLYSKSDSYPSLSWWRHQMETFSALLALYAGNSPVTGEFPSRRPVTRSFDVFLDLRLNKRLSKQSWGWWFETLSHPLWHHCKMWGFFIQSVIHIQVYTVCSNVHQPAVRL